ncbi:transposase-like protein [Kerstersia gyiorum]|nr:transposase-like protein [Kerstersia gyiorum]MCP1635466.1 transposase-like protein [Kerstersia gyiorum]MCP1669605.1 transposase-like protein [Kerstersia gyiorum]MCP1677742.1 transposase-like protein [Kerstersia gyiorum]MCP1681253.1 transposase-like protein [Kerstersia gyiorum]
MSKTMEEDIKRWTAKRKSALVLDIIQGKTTVSEASRQYDLSPSEVEQWVDDAKRGMENALRANPLDIKEQYERQLKDLQEAYGEAMLELRARKKLQALLDEEGNTAKWHGRTRDPHTERAMCTSPPLRNPAACQPRDW